MASAFTRLFLPSHRKNNNNNTSSNTNSNSNSRRHDASRARFPTSSTFDLRHSIPEESASATDATFPALPSSSSLTVHHLNRHVSPPITDATLRRNSLAFEPAHTRPSLPRSFSAYDITLPPESDAGKARIATPPSPAPPAVDDDDDLDTNPLYLRLSEHEDLQADWSAAEVALVPLARAMAAHSAVQPQDLDDPAYIALHAFAPSKLYKHQFVSVRSVRSSVAVADAGQYDWSRITLTATLDADRRSITIVQSPAAATRTVAILGETTIYRSTPTAKVRVFSVDLPIVHRLPATNATPPQPDEQPDEADQSVSDLILRHVAAERVFAADLVLLAHPHTSSARLDAALSGAFSVLVAAAHQFTASFVYVRGFDSYNAHRIRRGIWFKAWKAFEERLGSEHVARLGVEPFHRIKSVLESVSMGLVHTKMYGPIQDQLLDADLVTDDVLAACAAANLSMGDLGVENAALRSRPDRLTRAVEVLATGLADEGGSEVDDALATADEAAMRTLAQRQVAPTVRIHSDLGIDAATQGVSLHRRTPLHILQTLRAVIDEVGWAAERASSRGDAPPLGTDDLLPILSYVFVRARPSRLCSMLYYARAFTLTDTATAPALQWALVTCDAVVAYLRTDPFRLVRRRSSAGTESVRKSTSTSAGDALLRSLSSRSQASSANLMVAAGMARSPSGPSASVASPPPSPRSPYPEEEGEEFKLPGWPASRRNSRILARPASVFSLEDDESLELGRGGRERTLSSSSGAEVQIRPQIVRTIKRGSVSARLERSGSSGSAGVKVRVVGSPQLRDREARRKSVDSWSFALFTRRPEGGGEVEDANCQPNGVELPHQPSSKRRDERWAKLVTSTVLPPQVDTSATSAAVSPPSLESMHALRASISKPA